MNRKLQKALCLLTALALGLMTLGAAALGDIGKWFPDTDPQWEGADSLKLLARVGEILTENRFLIENIDSTIIAQAPKMRPHIDTMRQNIADALGLDISQVSVKATTEEHLGFTGRGEGISAQAVALLNTPMDMLGATLYDGMPGMQPGGCSTCGGCPVRA